MWDVLLVAWLGLNAMALLAYFGSVLLGIAWRRLISLDTDVGHPRRSVDRTSAG